MPKVSKIAGPFRALWNLVGVLTLLMGLSAAWLVGSQALRSAAAGSSLGMGGGVVTSSPAAAGAAAPSASTSGSAGEGGGWGWDGWCKRGSGWGSVPWWCLYGEGGGGKGSLGNTCGQRHLA